MASFRFELYENVITKHNLSRVDWTQAAKWSFARRFNQADWTVASIKQIDSDTVEIVKRRDQNKSICYKYGFDQKGLFERVIINRKTKEVTIDRLDANWLVDEPFMAQRDQFKASTKNQGSLDFIRYNFWLSKLLKFEAQFTSNFSAWSYKRAFKNTPTAD